MQNHAYLEGVARVLRDHEVSELSLELSRVEHERAKSGLACKTTMLLRDVGE